MMKSIENSGYWKSVRMFSLGFGLVYERFVEFPKSFVSSSVVITTTRSCSSFKSLSLD